MEENKISYIVASNVRSLIKQANDLSIDKQNIISIISVKDAVYLVY